MEQKTWDNFMECFRKEQRNLRRTGELTVADTINKEDFVHLLKTGIQNSVEQALAAKESEEREERDNAETREPEIKETSELKKQLEQMNATIMKMQQEKMQNPYNNMVPP
jgi:hypothetical protein